MRCETRFLERVNVASHISEVGAKWYKRKRQTTTCSFSQNFEAIYRNMLSKVERQRTGIFIHQKSCSETHFCNTLMLYAPCC